MNVFIIAEAGVNHNGDPEMALKLVDAAIEAGADAVKFQTFDAHSLVTSYAGKAAYQKRTTDARESQAAMLKRLELPLDTYCRLAGYCHEKGIQFLSTAFDFKSLTFLIDEIGMRILKVSSGDVTNGPFLLAHAQTGRNIILSTGMATLGEVEAALSVLAFGFVGTGKPSKAAFQTAFFSTQGQKSLLDKVTLLHCTTEYPSPMSDINLRAMDTMAHAFGLKVGYSDHSEGIAVPIAAVARGAEVIEKHFTLNSSLPGPDHKASLEPETFKTMVRAIRDVELMLGNGLKGPQQSELDNRDVARRSLVAKRDICLGEQFTEENMTVKRPGTGKSPMEYWTLLGTACERDMSSDELL